MNIHTILAVVGVLLLVVVVINLTQLRKIMAVTAQQLIAAGTATVASVGALSAKVDTLIAAADAVVAALQNVSLPPEADAAVTALQTATAAAAAEGDKVDAEVTKLDALLPTPAPPAPTP